MLYLVFLTFGLATFWLLMSGYWYDPLLLTFGAVSILLCLFIAWKIEKKYPFHRIISILPGLPLFWLWLFKEVVIANIEVLKRIWMPSKFPITPTIRTLPMSQKTRMGKTTYANAITLTPGTISIDVKGSEVQIHGLFKDSLDDLEKGEMDKRVAQLERKIL